MSKILSFLHNHQNKHGFKFLTHCFDLIQYIFYPPPAELNEYNINNSNLLINEKIALQLKYIDHCTV